MSYNTDRTISQVLTQDETSGNWVDGGRVVYGYGPGTMTRKLAGFIQAAQDKATRKLVSMKGNQHATSLEGGAFNALGRQCNVQAAAPSTIRFVVVKNAASVQR